jgi:two-component system chemotaxis sensor kinase CheA
VTHPTDERGGEMRDLFFETSQELLQLLNDEALKLEKYPADAELVRSIRRIVHTLKGDAAACGFRELSNAAHALEDALALESPSNHDRLAEVAFAAADTFGAMLTAYQRRSKLPSTVALAKMIRELSQQPKTSGVSKPTSSKTQGKKAKPSSTKLSTAKRSRKAAPAADVPAENTEPVSPAEPAGWSALGWTEYENLAIQNAQSRGRNVFHIAAGIDPLCLMPIAARQLVLNALKVSGEVLAARPEPSSPESSKRLELLVASNKSAEELTVKCRIPSVISRINVDLVAAAAPARKGLANETAERKTASSEISSLNAASPETGEEHPRGDKTTHAHAENTLRVDAQRIDSVLDLVGELIIGKSMLQQAFAELARHVPKEALRGRFSDAMAFQARVLNDLQRSVMKIRMVPVEQLFRRFPRMVRDVARQCGKDVELVMQGQDTDLDKSLLDAIAEPITHLVRNAISHGIESAEERVHRGKPARGTVQLRSYHQGNQVILEIKDDGRGIDSEKIKAKAVEAAIIAEEEADRLGEAAILDLVFTPGLSTADEITEVSGRGVGMDVVKNVLHRLKGSVEIETRAGQGTTFRLKLPLTLAIIRALLFKVEQRLYAIPLNAVAEIARARESDVHQIHNYEVLQLRDRVLPVVRLGSPRVTGIESAASKIFVLVVSMGERTLGLIVDSLRGEEELVIKALDDQSVATDLISGASILGDGRVVLIVNVPAIVDRHSRARPQQEEGIVSGMLLARADRKSAAASASGVLP